MERFQVFVAEVQKLGEVQSLKIDSDDVTEQYVDLEARLASKKKTEQRLLEHLESNTAKLEDILSVERELDRVREEIERMEGKLRYLKNRVDYTTVQIDVYEIYRYESPKQPSYFTLVWRTWANSLSLLKDFLVYVSLALVAILPWLPVILVGLVVLVVAFRGLVRTLRATTGKPTD